jgi:hypothetical protein
MNEDSKTDPDSPLAKRESSAQALKLEDCPQCKRDGFTVMCACCGGGRKVAHATAEDWRKAHP